MGKRGRGGINFSGFTVAYAWGEYMNFDDHVHAVS